MTQDAGTATAAVLDLAADPVASAKVAGLRYVSDASPGWTRKRRGKGFAYFDQSGKRITAADDLRRIGALKIPPAWEKVWICPDARGHIQAVGRDARGRKQYRYHARWREVRDETKYGKVLEFAAALPKIRAATERDFALPGLPRDKVLAAVVRLLETTLIRVGNEEYARENGSFGLTTMRDWHAKIDGTHVRFHFRGKSGKERSVDIRDGRLARIVKKCQDLPGEELFQYIGDDGERHTIDSADVNEYLHRVAGGEFTAKDFRTWAGTVLATMALQEIGASSTKTAAKKNVVEAIKRVSERLGNTPAVCKRCYVHPAVLDGYLEGTMLETLKQNAEKLMDESLDELRPEEAAVVAFLDERLRREVEERKAGGLVAKLRASVGRARKRKARPRRAAKRRIARR